MALTTLAVLAGLLLGACGGSGKSTASRSTSTTSTSSSIATARSTAVTGTSEAPGVLSASADDITATMHATTHSPKVNVGWPISFKVTRAGKPVQAKLSYEYLFAGNVVAKRSNYTFTGHFSDLFRWPGSAVGYPLTFRAVILAGGQTFNLDYPVQVLR
jgi:hypothetical protein